MVVKLQGYIRVRVRVRVRAKLKVSTSVRRLGIYISFSVFVVKLYSFCLSVAYIVHQCHPYTVYQLSVMYMGGEWDKAK